MMNIFHWLNYKGCPIFSLWRGYTVYPKKYVHGFVVLCFIVVMPSFIMNSHEVFIHIHQGCFAGTEAIVRLPQCQRSKPDGYEKIGQCITTTKHSKAKTVCICLGIYCTASNVWKTTASQWIHNGPYGVSNHQPQDCLLKRLIRRRSRKYQSSVSMAFVRGIHRWIPQQRASDAENVSIWCGHHGVIERTTL